MRTTSRAGAITALDAILARLDEPGRAPSPAASVERERRRLDANYRAALDARAMTVRVVLDTGLGGNRADALEEGQHPRAWVVGLVVASTVLLGMAADAWRSGLDAVRDGLRAACADRRSVRDALRDEVQALERGLAEVAGIVVDGSLNAREKVERVVAAVAGSHDDEAALAPRLA